MKLVRAIFLSAIIGLVPLVLESQINEEHTIHKKRLAQAIAKDSVYEATILLHEDIAYAKANNRPISLAYTYRTLGTIFSKIGSSDIAANYLIEAAKIFESLNEPEELDNALMLLCRAYVEGENYKTFDSISPIALNQSLKLHSVNIFYNLESKVRHNYYLKNYEASYKDSEEALKKLDGFTFSSAQEKLKKNKFTAVFKFYAGASLINMNHIEKGYNLLFSIDSNNFNVTGEENTFPTSQVSTFYYYKFKYFKNHQPEPEKANAYLLISDSIKFVAIKDFQNKMAKNGDLIYKIIDTEKQLELSKIERKQEKALSNAFLVATIILSLLLTASGVFLYYYYNNRNRIKTINQRLSESNNRLKLIDKERLEFFSILSHELRTPIYGINGLATLIEQEQSPEKRKNYLNALMASSSYISVLIDNVLQISKLKFENKALHLRPTDIEQLITKISSSIKVSADQKKLKLYSQVKKTHSEEYLLIDKVVLSQILINLTYNAIRYTKKGFISINAREQSRTETHVNLLFEIRDSGIGIENKNRDIIFNAFENKTFLKKSSTGSGLGLYIVKTLLRSYHAEIKFESKPNQGSMFYFDIDFEIAKVPKSAPPHLTPSLENPIKILIVDDNTINLMISQKNVERISGCFSETSTLGREAICLVKEKDFDMVLMDINMPDMDGFEATKHIRLFNPHIPILALTALNSAEIQKKAKACGINHVITKPYDFNEFKALIVKYGNVLQDY